MLIPCCDMDVTSTKPFSEQPRESFCTVLIFKGVDIPNFMIEWYESNPTYIQGNPIGLLKKKKKLCLGPTRAREEAHGTTGTSRSLTRAHAQAQHSTQRYGRRPDRPRGGSQWSPATSCFFPFFLVVYSFIFFPFISSCTCSIAAAHGCYHDSKREKKKKKVAAMEQKAQSRPWPWREAGSHGAMKRRAEQLAAAAFLSELASFGCSHVLQVMTGSHHSIYSTAG